MEGSPEITKDNWTEGVFSQMKPSYNLTEEDKNSIKINQPHDIEDNIKTHSAEEAYRKVIKSSGASLVRDAVDLHVLKDIETGTFTYKGSKGSKNGIIDSQNDTGGFPLLKQVEPLLDSDNDGMPDEWEIRHHLNPKSANANGRDLDKNYDNIEVYFNDIVSKITDKQR